MSLQKMNLIVKNLHIDIANDELKALFSPYGEVVSVEVIYDPFNGYSKGKGYVRMKTQNGGFAAIKALHGMEVKGQVLQVHEKLENKIR